ncbi:hypothetical protein PTKIN_Ptkin14bG0050200 [Pterospermum kingtungense]
MLLLLIRRKRSSERVPPGSLGFPIIGQSLGLHWAMRANTAEEWLQKRIRKYGPISKMSLFGKPAVFIYGQAANKFVFTSDSSTIINQQVNSFTSILGDWKLLELNGEDHKRVRDVLVSFLKPESLEEYIGKMDEEVRKHLEMHWHGKQQVTASARAQKMLKDLIAEKRKDLEQKDASPRQDLISCLLSIRNNNNEQVMSEKKIIHNIKLIMVAGHDTSSVLLTSLVHLLAIDPAIYAAVLQEQEEIEKGEPNGELLTWENLAKMKYTWKVARETLRLVPPIFGGFRKAVNDIEYAEYLIPKDWQVNFWATGMTQMDDSIFPEPSKFDLTRFENPASIPPYCFIPFGGGPRICPGNEFARIEALVSTHYLVTRYTWKLPSDNFFCRDPTPVPTKGLPVQMSPRKPF